MIYKLFILLFILLYFIYIATVIAQCFNIFKVTNLDIRLPKALIPFYYWIHRNF